MNHRLAEKARSTLAAYQRAINCILHIVFLSHLHIKDKTREEKISVPNVYLFVIRQHRELKKNILIAFFFFNLCVNFSIISSVSQHTVVTVQGDHHTHLNNPETVAPLVSDFLQTKVISQQ